MPDAPSYVIRNPTVAFLFTAGLAVLIFAMFAAAQSLSPGEVRISSRPYRPESQVLRAESKLVQVEVVVRDINGRPVSGLTKANFEVLDSGLPKEIAEFSVETSHEIEQAATNPTKAAPSASPSAAAQLSVPESAPPRRRWIVLFFDDINTLPGDLAHAKIAAKRFIKQAGIDGDWIAVFTSSDGQILDFTHVSDAVLAATAQVKSHPRMAPGGVASCPRITAYEAYQIANHDETALQAKVDEACQCTGVQTCGNEGGNISVGGNISLAGPDKSGTSLLQPIIESVRAQADATWSQARVASQDTLDAVGASIARLAQMPGKRMLLLASSGFFSFGLDQAKDQIVNQAVRSDVVINSLDSKGLYAEAPVTTPINETVETLDFPVTTLIYETESLGDRLDSVDAAMARLAESTGGLLYRNNNDLNAGFYQLGVVPDYAYELGIVPDEDGKYHRIKVELVNVKHKFIQARPGYFAPTKEGSAPTAAEKLDSEMMGSDDRSDFPTTMHGALGAMKSGMREITIQTHVDISKLPFEREKDRQREKLTFVAGLFDAQNKFVVGKEADMDFAFKRDSYDRFTKSGITGAMSLQAPPGNYRLRIVVEEAVKGEMSASSQNVQIQ